MSHSRVERIGDQIREEIASMLVRGELKDPRIGFTTITRVKMSPDLKNAKVFFSVIGEGSDADTTLEGLKSAAPYVRRELARKLRLKYIPAVSFQYDASLAYAERIEGVLKEVKESDDAKERENE
ncbi:MAG: 30S ribosome-binding factor RbfA [Deltaproteobacteria bacterium]|nr:30S ribosome-binding factor RbfA [Deltaproteobacteria bacterium]